MNTKCVHPVIARSIIINIMVMVMMMMMAMCIHSKCQTFYTTMISGEKNLRQKCLNFGIILIATNCIYKVWCDFHGDGYGDKTKLKCQST